MKALDYVLPHRLMLNGALKKSSEQLRKDIDDAQNRYKEKQLAVEKELKEAEASINTQLNEARDSLNAELNQNREDLSELMNLVVSYVEKRLYHQAHEKMIQIYSLKKKICSENASFLSEQIKLIDERVNLLEERVRQLTAYTDIHDVLELAAESGYDFGIKDNGDARELLLIVSKRISDLDGIDKYERFALIRLKNIIQEKSEYIPAIKFLKWDIISERKHRRYLKSLKSEAILEIEKINESLNEIQIEYQSFDEKTKKWSEQIRYYWAKPLAYCNAKKSVLLKEISEAKEKKEDLIEEFNDAKEELERMALMHESDQYKWDRLKREKSDLSDDIEVQKSIIQSNKIELTQTNTDIKYWKSIRDAVYKLCREKKAWLISDKDNEKRDEERIIENRLKELEAIRIQGMADAKTLCEADKARISSIHITKINELNGLLADLNANLEALNKELIKATEKKEYSERILIDLKKNDSRGFIKKLFSDTSEIARAKAVIQRDNAAIGSIQEKIREINKRKKEISISIDNENETYNQNLSKCYPKCLRPTKEEKDEEKMLLFRLEEIERYKSEEREK